MAGFLQCVRADFKAALDNDPAARGLWAPLEVVLSYPGFHAIFLHRVTHVVHRLGIPLLPRLLSMFNRFLTGVEIHQAARIGPGFFIDHGMGVVIGETAIVGRNCMLFHQVTLGGTGKETGKRHPTLKDSVVIGAGAKILGNITLGNNVYVGSNSVVLKNVPDNCTVVGVPGRIVIREGVKVAAHALDHIHLPDPVRDGLRKLESELQRFETLIANLTEEKREGLARPRVESRTETPKAQSPESAAAAPQRSASTKKAASARSAKSSAKSEREGASPAPGDPPTSPASSDSEAS